MRVRVDEHLGSGNGRREQQQHAAAEASSERQRDSQRQRHRERAAAGTLRPERLNTLQSHPILTPSRPAHKPVRDVNQTGALLQPLLWQVSHPASHSAHSTCACLEPAETPLHLARHTYVFTPKPRDPSALPSLSSPPPKLIPAPRATWVFKGGRPAATRARRCPPKRTGQAKADAGSCAMLSAATRPTYRS